MLFYIKYLFIYFLFYTKFVSSSEYIDIFEGSGQDEDSEELNISDLLIYDQGLPIAKFPILAKSSSKSGLIPLAKGTTGELTGFTSGLTEEMKKLLNEDKNGMKFSRRKNGNVNSASVHNVVVGSKDNKENILTAFSKNSGSNEEDLYNNLPEERGQFLVEKMPFYLGAMIRNNGMKSLNAFGAYGKSRNVKPFSKENGGYGSFFGDKEFKLKPGQYFAGQAPPNINLQDRNSNNQGEGFQQSIIKKGANFRDVITSSVPKNPTVSKDVIQKLLVSANSAAQTYNRMKVTNSNQNINSQKTYLSPSLSKIGVVTSLNTKSSNQPIITKVHNNSQQHDKVLNTNNKIVVHGISMTQFKKYPTSIVNNENKDSILTTLPKNSFQTSDNIISFHNLAQIPFNGNLNPIANNQQFSNKINQNFLNNNEKTAAINQTMNGKNVNGILNYDKLYGGQLNELIHQQKSSNVETPQFLIQHKPYHIESNKNLFTYSDSHQNNLKIEDFNNELYNKNLNSLPNINSDIEITCCDGNLMYTTISCCNLEPKTNDIAYYQNDGTNNNVVGKNEILHYNTPNQVSESSEEYGDLVNKPKNGQSFKSYKPISKIQPIFTDTENFSPLPERIGDIYSNNFGKFNV